MSIQGYGLGVKIAQMVGVGVSAFASGFVGSISILWIPSILVPTCPPTLATKQWLKMYDIGKVVGPLLTVVGGSAYIYLAYASRGTTAYAYAAAASATLLHVPFTLTVMMPTNNYLLAHAKGDASAKAAPEAEVRKYIQAWGDLNAVRAVGPGVGAIVGLAVLLGLIV